MTSLARDMRGHVTEKNGRVMGVRREPAHAAQTSWRALTLNDNLCMYRNFCAIRPRPQTSTAAWFAAWWLSHDHALSACLAV
jgi:hypothetical protein